ncbi:aminopeptidase [Oceanicoccus sp. KOV_DT_Chl]|uniref:aminopeptidase n=1 Tax=Oceanicoccus sp. KOV_DT_Chl TaxID=1904639 RepID=UPI001F1675E9|nr:aminopeptidase [Oceanicoccus sp. KOV_DT_Chl]
MTKSKKRLVKASGRRGASSRWVFRLLILVALTGVISGCETAAYYSQAAQGQWSIWWQRQKVNELLHADDTSPQLKQQLLQVQQYRQFASEQLGLPDNNSYRYYADTERDYVVWNVFAASPFSIEPLQWCFPIAGCVSYRGYFSEQKALDYAQQLQQQGYETYVGGVSAYSTLGWFDDPLLNTFIYRKPLRLAGLIFHELAHQQVYVGGDTVFNESFATAVELAGIERWVQQQRLDPLQVASYQQQRLMQADFVEMLLAFRQQLEQLYAEPVSEQQKQQRKQQLFSESLPIRYQHFKQRWHHTTAFDSWMQQPVNNARLVTVASYHQWVPAFQQLLLEQGSEMGLFYQQVALLARLEKKQRQAQLLVLQNRRHSLSP